MIYTLIKVQLDFTIVINPVIKNIFNFRLYTNFKKY